MNKKHIVFLILIIAVIIFAVFYGAGDDKNKNLSFDIDLNNLSYQLPTHSLVCVPESKQFCSSGGECKAIKAEVFLLVDEVSSKYSRCDNNPCDTYDATFTKSGVYTVINPLPPQHGEVKISMDGSYTETNTLGDSVYISRGICSKSVEL